MTSSTTILQQLRNMRCREILVADLNSVGSNVIRIETRLMRSNGSYVDLFIDHNRNAGAGNQITLSDFGTTSDYLSDAGKLAMRSTLQYIANSYGLELDGQALSIRCQISDFLKSLLRLAQACVALSNPRLPEPELASPTLDTRVPAIVKTFLPDILPSQTTSHEVSVILEETKTPFSRFTSVRLREDYNIQIDFLIRARGRRAALMVVEHSPYRKVTARRADHAFAIHTDLKDNRWRGQRISVIDDDDLHRTQDDDSFIRLGRVSQLISPSRLREGDVVSLS